MKALIFVAALGYFVDVYDLVLFSVVRVSSLQSLGLSGEQLLSDGLFLLNMQMLGLLLGGILWGVWGDKRGRISVLFGSIFLYSFANVANGFVHSVESYAFWRFIAGIGLAGELGAGITLVAETLPKEKRGIGTTVVATVGVMGALVAALTCQYFDWRVSYFIGGALGFLLLILRFAVHESGLFNNLKNSEVARGSLTLLLKSRSRLARYIFCILAGVPIWYIVGILVTFSPEIGTALQVSETPVSGTSVLYCYTGFVLGDLSSGLLSHFLKSRKKVIFLYLFLTTIFCGLYLGLHGLDITSFYLLCLGLGFSGGYWAMFVTVAAEQFGTNLRATVTTTAPNFVRGATVITTSLFHYLTPYTGIVHSAGIVAMLCILVAFYATTRLAESFSWDLDYLES